MKAIILAAGRGSRLKNLTDERPKCLVELHGKALLDWQLEALREAGIKKIGIVTGYKRELLARQDLVQFYNPRWGETQMVSSLACASAWLEQEPCVVSYSDIFYDASAPQMLIESSADITVTYDPNWLELWVKRFDDPLLDAETFRLNQDKTLVEIGNKPDTLEQVEGQYMGLLKFTPKGWEATMELRSALSSKEWNAMQMTRMLNGIIQGNLNKVYGVPYSGSWGEVDSQDDLNLYSIRKNNN